MDLTEKESGVSQTQTACKQAHFLRDVLFHGKFQVRVACVSDYSGSFRTFIPHIYNAYAISAIKNDYYCYMIYMYMKYI